MCGILWTMGAAGQAASGTLPEFASLKARIVQDDRRRPELSIQLAQQALAQASATTEDRIWLRSRLIRDLIRMRRTDEALGQARAGFAEARNAEQQLHFEVLAWDALCDAQRNEEVVKRYRDLEAQLRLPAGNTRNGADSLDVANGWRLAGTAMMRLGQLPESIHLLTQALRVFDALPDAVYESSQTLTAMALVDAKSGNPEQALRTVQRAIDLSVAANERSSLSGYQLRKAYLLSLLGRTDEQEQALLTARTLAQQELMSFNVGVAATNLADVALQKKDYRAALAYTDEAIPMVEQSGDKESLWVAWINKGTALNRLGRPGGIDWIRKALAAFAAAPGMDSNVAETQGYLAEELAFNHDYQGAYEAAMRFERLTDGVRKAADQKRIAEANAAYEADKRQRQIEGLEAEQRQQRRFRWMLALAAAAGLTAAVIAAVSRYHVKRAYGAVRSLGAHNEKSLEEERKRVARELHDEMGQQLAALRMELSVAQHSSAHADPAAREAALSALTSRVDALVASMRSVVGQLRPPAMDGGLEIALAWLASELERQAQVQCDVHVDEELRRLPADAATLVFRIAQECLSNVRRHAAARRVHLELVMHDGQCEMSVEDDGSGFDVTATRSGYGILGMEERARMLVGTLVIDSAPGHATTVTLRFPMPAPAG
ncbi:MAG: histidine kinase [Burkholderiaceae bacterium]